MKILHLTLKKKWFDMILSGEKKEEYREGKNYWQNRLVSHFNETSGQYVFKKFDLIIFRNGYSKQAPEMEIECKGIDFNYGKEPWGAVKYKLYFVIELGKIISTKNIK